MKLQHIIFLLIFVLLLVQGTAYADNVNRSTFKVLNISCLSCVGRIEAELKKVPGIIGMTADPQNGLIMTDHSTVLASEEIARVITKAGYSAYLEKSSLVDRSEAFYFSNTSVERCGVGGCNPQGCSASGAAWKELYRRFMKRASN